MNGVIVNFRSSRHRQKHNYMVVQADGVTSKDKAKELVGKTVVWKSPANKELKGKITKEHGGKGCVRVLFETGMPGQSVGTKVDIS